MFPNRIGKLLVALAGTAALLVSTAGAATTGTPYEVNVILSLTGPIAFLGQDELKALRALEGVVNERGGIQGHPLSFAVVDDQSSPVLAVQLATGLIQKKVPIVMGPVVTATCAAVVPLMKDGPVLYCLSPAIHPVRGSYIFSSSVTILDSATGLLRYARDRGWNKMALITATDASGQEVDRAFGQAFALPENATALHLVDHQHFNASDLSVDAQMAHIKAQVPDAVIAWTTGTSFGTLLHGIRNTGITQPIVAGAGNMAKAQLAQYGELIPQELVFPGLRGMSLNAAPGPVRDAQNVYFTALKKAGLEPFSANFVWDYAMVLVDALRHIGVNATAEQIRDYIDNLHGWAGIEGVYDFHDPEQRGMNEQSVVVYRWDGRTTSFIPVSKPGGHIR
jgi:branched-chain amino acid transport system substrate-binding protein